MTHIIGTAEVDLVKHSQFTEEAEENEDIVTLNRMHEDNR
jgi:hypothetical protein